MSITVDPSTTLKSQREPSRISPQNKVAFPIENSSHYQCNAAFRRSALAKLTQRRLIRIICSRPREFTLRNVQLRRRDRQWDCTVAKLRCQGRSHANSLTYSQRRGVRSRGNESERGQHALSSFEIGKRGTGGNVLVEGLDKRVDVGPVVVQRKGEEWRGIHDNAGTKTPAARRICPLESLASSDTISLLMLIA